MTDTDDLAARLLEAHLAFERDQLRGSNYHALVLEEIEHALETASTVTLAEAVTPAMIRATALKYAAQVPVEGAIPELVGEIAARLYRHRANDENTVAQIVDAHEFEGLAAAIAELDVTRRVAERIWTSPTTADAAVAALAHTAVAVADDGRALLDRHAATRAARRLVARLRLPTSERTALQDHTENVLRRAVTFVLERAAGADAPDITGAARDLWRRHRSDTVAGFRDLVSDDDVDAVVVAVFEFWRTFRNTDYFASLLGSGVDYVFEKYGDTPLYELLEELGVGREDMIEEALRFGPPVIGMLDERGLLEPLLRRRLAPFYASDEFRAAAES
ncbi:hypothetical protein [Tsukamurella soli]|uniref:DUF2336 domain-containing protein n=1 Tax=Tsukamurella soli TaxID=644556 RepID=A0ABP8JQ02_9ACTN